MVQLKNFNPPRVNTPHVIYEDRYQPPNYDFTLATPLTTDGAWHDIDLSAVVPAGAKAVHLRVLLIGPGVANVFSLRRNATSGTYNAFRTLTQVAASPIDACGFVTLDTDRIIQYMGDNVAWDTINLVIRGWLI